MTKTEMSAPKIGKLVKKNEIDDPNVGKVGVVGKLVRNIEMSGLHAGKIMKNVETGDGKVGELVQKVQMNDPKVGKVGRSVRVGQEEHMNLEQDAMLADLVRRTSSSSASTTSLERSCLGRLRRKHERKSCSLCVNLASVKCSMSTQLWQSTTLRQSTQSFFHTDFSI